MHENTAQERRSSLTGLTPMYRQKSCEWKEINVFSVETTARGPTLRFYKGHKLKHQAGGRVGRGISTAMLREA